MPRKKPFSGKKKKEQLKERRKKRANRRKNSEGSVANNTEGTSQTKEKVISENSTSASGVKLVTSFGGNDVRNVDNRLATMMIREDDEEVRKRRLQGSVPVDTSKQGTFPKAVHTPLKQTLYHPRRPKWKSNLTALEVETNEKIQFDSWCSAIHSSYEQGQITPFEHNLEVWRQLWRVIEQSDVLLLTCDCRNPLFHISQSLVDECLLLRKPVIIVLTKTDLVPAQHVHQWIAFLKHLYPFVNVFPFSSRGTLSENEVNKLNGGVASRRKVLKKKPNVQQATKSVKQLLLLCAAICNVNILRNVDDDDTPNNKPLLSIGLCGHPNTGKTSLVNAIVGRKVASVSRTAGHTKHLQHIPLDYPKGVYLIDCPGLIFPKEQPRFLGEVMGLYPIAQIREPFSSIRVVYEYLQLDRLYNLKKPDWYEKSDSWSPEMLCEALAEKKGYMLSRSGAPDIQRAGLEVITDIVDGVLCLRFDPPNAYMSGSRSAYNNDSKNTAEEELTDSGDNDDSIRNDAEMNAILESMR